MKKPRRHLPLLQVDHPLDIRLGGSDPRRRGPRYPSPEIERDAAIEVEPDFEVTTAEGFSACDLEARQLFVRRRHARALQGTYEPVAGVPETRGDCPDERPCVHYRCRFFLWMSPPAGRPGLEDVPRDAQGWTESVRGDFGDGRARERLQLQPRWLEGGTVAPSCALDEIDRHDGRAMSNEAVGNVFARHRTLIAREVRAALEALRAKGVTARDLMRLTDEYSIENDREPTRRRS